MSFVLPVGQHRFTEVLVCDEPGSGGAYHHYEIIPLAPYDPVPYYEVIPADSEERTAPYSLVAFQNGPAKEVGVNGIFIEDLLAICQHRLECFQSGDFACRENALALTKIQEAMHWLNHRTSARQSRGVEGTDQK